MYTWFATTNLPKFNNLDLAPLLNHLVAKKLVSAQLYLGTVQFGTEAYYSAKPVNFSVSSFQAKLGKVGKNKGSKRSVNLLE